MVDSEIVAILRNRYEDCVLYNQEIKACDNLYEILEEASADWCAKRKIILFEIKINNIIIVKITGIFGTWARND